MTFAGFSAKAQTDTRILFVFDASNSMNGYWERERKIEVATRLLIESLDNLADAENVELALRVYGHQTKHIPGQQDCDDTELVVPFAEANNLVIAQALKRLTPQGTTPIARSLEKAAEDFPDDKNVRNVIILITDGIEACDEDPCAVSKALQAKGIILKPFIIGIGIDDKYKSTFQCVGNYFDATKEESFKTILDIVVTQALNNTTLQINLLDESGLPTISDIPFTLYDSKTGEILYNLVHTLNYKGNPDTLNLDPLFTYRMVAHTYPEIEIDELKLTPGKHNTWDVQAAQGSIDLSFGSGRSEYSDLKCLVMKDGECDLVNLQDFGTSEKYLRGEYQLKILTSPPTTIPKVIVLANEVTEVKIPTPGVLFLQTGGNGQGGIFRKVDNELELVKKFGDVNPSGRYTLQPGKYFVIFRSSTAKQTVYTIEKPIEIKSGSNTNLRL